RLPLRARADALLPRGGGQPRSRGLRRPGALRRAPQGQPPRLVRLRGALLPGRAARADGGADRPPPPPRARPRGHARSAALRARPGLNPPPAPPAPRRAALALPAIGVRFGDGGTRLLPLTSHRGPAPREGIPA